MNPIKDETFQNATTIYMSQELVEDHILLVE
jgi:hypothetical protein